MSLTKPVISQDFIQYLFFVFGGVLVHDLQNAQGIFVKNWIGKSILRYFKSLLHLSKNLSPTCFKSVEVYGSN